MSSNFLIKEIHFLFRCLEIEEGKKQINERPTVPLYPTSEPKLPISENANDDDLPISTQREPILVLHIYTPQQNEAKVQTNRVSENSAINNRVYQNEQVVDEGHLQCPFLGLISQWIGVHGPGGEGSITWASKNSSFCVTVAQEISKKFISKTRQIKL